MATFVLIMVLWDYRGTHGVTTSTVTAKFESFELCETARKHIEKSMKRVIIESQGCYAAGRVQ